MKNEQLLNKTISTNEKVVLTYKDTNSKDYTLILSSSPKIQLSELKEELNTTVNSNQSTETVNNVDNKDNTIIASGKLPQTGINITIIFVILLIAIISLIIYKKYNSYKDIK